MKLSSATARAARSCMAAFTVISLLAMGSSGVHAASASPVSLVQIGHIPTGFENHDLDTPRTVPATWPSSVTFYPGSGTLFVTDSEINEEPHVFERVGGNVFEITRDGSELLNIYDLTRLGNIEPTGIVYSAYDDHFYVTNDDARTIYRYAFDRDSANGFALVDQIAIKSHGFNDPEGITVDQRTGVIYVIGGTDRKIGVYTYDEGTGFSLVEILDLVAINGNPNAPRDPNGGAIHPETGHLWVVCTNQKALWELTTDGVALAKHDISTFEPTLIIPEGLSFGPASNPLAGYDEPVLYLTDRGVDNNTNNAILQGGIYEIALEDDRPTVELFEPIPDQTVAEGEQLGFTATPSPPTRPLTFSLEGSVPQGAAIDAHSGTFSWIPAEEHGPGVYRIRVRAQDTGDPSLVQTRIVRVAVTEVNRPPVLGPIDPVQVEPGEEVTFTATATDPDLVPGPTNGLLAYWSFDDDFSSATGSNDGIPFGDATITGAARIGGGALSLDGATGRVAFGPLQLDGDFTVAGWVNPANVAPVTSGGAALLGDANDENWLRLGSDGVRGTWGGNTTTWPADPGFVHDQWQHFALTRTGSTVTLYRDGVIVGGGTKTQTFTPGFIGRRSPNGDHYAGSIDDLAIWERALSATEISALHGGGEGAAVGAIGILPANTLTFSLEGATPDGAEIDPSTGVFTWTPTEVGVYEVTIAVTDGEFSDAVQVSLTVAHPNRPPALDPIGNRSMEEGKTLVIALTADDPDGDPLSFSIDGAPSWATLQDHGNGSASLTLSPARGDAGEYSMTVRVSDGEMEDAETFTVTVTQAVLLCVPHPVTGQNLLCVYNVLP